jgi:hypothetical protein
MRRLTAVSWIIDLPDFENDKSMWRHNSSPICPGTMTLYRLAFKVQQDICLAVHAHQSVMLSVSSSRIGLTDGGVTSGLICEYFIAILCWLIGSDVGVSYT